MRESWVNVRVRLFPTVEEVMRRAALTAAAAASISCWLLVAVAGGASAAEIKVLHTTAVKPAMDELLVGFQKSSGHKTTAEYGTAGAIVARLQKGEAADVVVVTGPQIKDLQKQGKIVESSGVELAKVGIAVYSRKGAPKRDIASVEAFKRALLAASSIAYIDPASGGASGIYISGLLERLDLAAELKTKIRTNTVVAAVFDSVASGAAEIGLGQLSEIAADPRVEIVGLLPAEIQNFTLFAAGVAAGSKEPQVAKALVGFISSPVALATWKAKGFEAP
jgi:molybdate transport system substrate-binding protein